MEELIKRFISRKSKFPYKVNRGIKTTPQQSKLGQNPLKDKDGSKIEIGCWVSLVDKKIRHPYDCDTVNPVETSYEVTYLHPIHDIRHLKKIVCTHRLDPISK